MKTWRQVTALLLIIVGVLIIVRGTYHTIAHGLSWQGIIVSLVMGALVISLGIARWRYWQGQQGR
ncbi:MAG: hypothetical protein N3B10_08850 [Armatimonadetes bacterium]|nr:hypothetical protein [Armatimonadota bacterium]